ncbi:MAG: amino acid carrier protein [Pirellulaceae bacterium]|nr:amino acid carrier protein [Pirellulaceae bacterium]
MLSAVGAVVFTFSWLGSGPVGVCQEAQPTRNAQDNVDFHRTAVSAQPEACKACEVDPETSDVSTPEQSLFRSNFALQLKLVNSFVSHLDFQVCRINSILAKILFYDFGTSQLKQFGAADIQPQTARMYFGGRHDELFAAEIPNALTNFSQRYERLPQDVNEARAALSSAGVALPDLPQGTAYDFDPNRSEFMVMPRGFGIPFIAAWLVFAGAFLTLRMRLINLRGLFHAIALISGKYDSSHKIGQLNHFRTFTTSLASTVGLGAISGVAIAVCLGGPGTAFWIMVFGVLAMSTKFTECTLGQIYRRVNAQGAVLGGPMRYLKSGFKLRKFVGFSMAPFGMVLSWLFAALCVCVSLTAGNTLQVSQSLGSLQSVKGLEFLQTEPWIFGLFMMAAVALVVLGGVRLIGRVTGWLAPLMCLFYVGACSWVIAQNSANLEPAFKAIFIEAFEPKALFSGSFIGVMIIGVTRASLTTDAGLGTASIAHAAARTDEPIREGIVSLLEPLLVTVMMCLLTALAIGVTGVAETAEGQALATKEQGTAVIMSALTNGMPEWFVYTLQAAMFLFAFSTCITWAYFGERCIVSLFGEGFSQLYMIVFVFFTFLGSVLSAANIMQFSLLLMLTLSIPNLLGVLLLNDVVREELDDYWNHYRNRKRDRSLA